MHSRVLACTVAAFLLLSSSAFGQFLNLPQYDNKTYFTSFVQADINHDGKTDIVGIRSTVTVLLGNGKGFGAPINSPITGVDNIVLQRFLLADFNGDGHLDIGLFGLDPVTGGTVVAVMFGNGDGTFQAPKETAITGIKLSSITTFRAGDFNGDGKFDVAFFAGNNAYVIFGKGDGTFSSPVLTSIFGTSTYINAADFNHDGKLDLVSTDGNRIFVYLGNGDGTFQSPITVGNGIGPIVVADLNGDSHLDLVAGIENRGAIVFLGDGTGHFPTQHSYTYIGGFTPTIAVHDLNGDGHPDIALFSSINTPIPPILTVLLNNGDGSFTVGKSYIGDGQPHAASLVPGDFNGDQKVDLAFENSSGGISVLAGNGDGTFKGNFAASPINALQDIRAGEFTTGLKPDVISSPSYQLLLGAGDGSFTVTLTYLTCVVNAIALGDFNNSGKLGFAGTAKFNGVPVIETCLGNGDGTFTEDGLFDQGIVHELVLAGDFNNDGKLDLVASDRKGFSVLLGNGDGTFQNGIPTAVNASFPILAVGDFNNDGKLDVAAETSSGLEVFPGKGDGTFGTPVVTPNVLSATYLTVTDLNKDGKLDLVATNPGLSVLLGKGDGTFQVMNYSYASTTRAAIADFTGDGNLDVAVGASTVGAPNGMADVFAGDGHGKLLTPSTTFRAGGPVIAIATSDFNGDGKPDLVLSLYAGPVVTLLHQ